MENLSKCVVCQKEFPKARSDLGYDTCLEHGEKPKQFTVAPAYNKGPLQLITRKYVKDIGRK